MIRWWLTLHSISANIYQTRLRSDCGAVRVCLHCCFSMMEGTVRNMPPVAFGIPTDNTVEIGLRWCSCRYELAFDDICNYRQLCALVVVFVKEYSPFLFFFPLC